MHGNSWGNQVTVISQGTTTKTISYDSAGNPTNYKGATLTWTRGRLLASYNAISMQYNADGIRKSKIRSQNNTTISTEYYYDGNNLVREKIVQANVSQSTTTNKTFLYNSQGIVGFAIGSTVYTYRKNLFGDIIAIYQGATKKAAYLYDAWGNCTITQDTDGIGTANPFRYRGYYWDSDLQLYYLMSRYYDPATGRFINADSLEYLDPETIGGLNLYSYCYDNPVMYADPSGHAAISFLVSLIIGGLVYWGLSELFGEHFATGTGLAITGGSAVVSGIMAMTLATPVGWIVGGITAVAGLFTLAFATAEFQQHFTNSNWMLDNWMNEETYYTLMTISSIAASVGTLASGVAYHYKIKSVIQKGKINGKMMSGKQIDGYPGLRFSSKTGKVYSIELHPNHNNHGVHIQWNQWLTAYPKFPGEYILKPLWRWRLW
ncbi:MAG: hypothetical protein IJF66_03235 [Clostridia bacterium]|nr:hypothetical protein [Clostridia bacterium]